MNEKVFLSEIKFKCIKCNNIFVDSVSSPFPGLLIFSDKIEQIINFAGLSEEKISKNLDKQENIIDFSDFYIFPGLIDLNTHLNSNYEEKDWGNAEEITKLSVQGGITTLIDNPLMNKYDEKFDEIKSLNERISYLKNSIYCDCGVFGYIGSHNYKFIEKIHETKLALGYKFHLTTTWIPDLPIIDKKSLFRLLKIIKEKPALHQILLAFHIVLATDREFMLCSPLKTDKLEKRLDLEENLRNSCDFAGGLPEEISDLKNKGDDIEINYLSDDEVEEWISKKTNTSQKSLTDLQKLELQAKILVKFQEENSIAKMELLQYEVKDSPLLETSEQSSSSCEENNDSFQIDPKEIEINNENNNEIPSLSPKRMFFSKNAFSSINSFQTKHPKPLILTQNPVKERFFHKEEIKTAELAQNRESFKKSEPSKLLSRRMVTSMSITSEKGLEKFNSLNSISSFEGKKVHDLKVDKMNTAKKEQSINHSYDMYLSNHSLTWETRGLSVVLNKLNKVFKEVSQEGNTNNIKAENSKTKVLFMNLSSNSLCFQIKKFKDSNLSANLETFAEVCTPYIFLHSGKIKPSQTKYKASPPIRIKKERDLFLQSIKHDSIIDVISSAHCYVPWHLKSVEQGNFRRSFEGLCSLGLNLQVVWTKLLQLSKKHSSFKDSIKLILEHENIKPKALEIESQTHSSLMKILVKKLCENPAKILNLSHKKGRILQGMDADFFIWSPFKSFKVISNDLPMKDSRNFIFKNVKFYGEIQETYLRGEIVFKRNEKPPHYYRKFGMIISQNDQN